MRTVYPQTVTSFCASLKKRAPILHKFLKTRLGFLISHYVGKLCFKLGNFSLKCFYSIGESLREFPGLVGEQVHMERDSFIQREGQPMQNGNDGVHE